MTRCGYVTLLGAPNAGKSTLLNALIGSKVAIVTPKAQTTRGPLLGIRAVGDTQLLFVDTPGVFAASGGFEKAMVDIAWQKAGEADAVLLIVDASRRSPEDIAPILHALARIAVPKFLVLNKVDAAFKPKLLDLTQTLNAQVGFEGTFMVSALKGSGVEDIAQALAARMPEGPWLYPADQFTDASERQIAAEITREQLFLRLHEELPYGLTVETESWEVKPDGSVKINQVVVVEREAHKKIVLGAGGAAIKAVGRAARAEITRALGFPAHLFLFVKVRGNWKSDPEHRRLYGLGE